MNQTQYRSPNPTSIGAVEEPLRVGQVARELENLHEAIGCANALFQDLAKRLQPVARQLDNKPECEPKAPVEMLCDHADKLRTLRCQVEILTSEIARLKQRLEL